MVTQDIEKIKSAFGDREFTGKDVANVLGITDYRATGVIVKGLRRDGLAYQTINGWRFGTPSVAPQASPITAAAPVHAVVATPIAPQLARIGEFYLSERMILIAHTGNQEGSPAIRFYTSILEIDPTTKHPRNKIVNFTKSRDPKEYAQALAWLNSMAGEMPPAVDDTALELAAELEKKLNAANAEIAELTRKLDIIRGAV